MPTPNKVPWLYNHLDFLIRFLYSRTLLGFLASRTLAAKLYRSNPETLNQLFQEVSSVWHSHHLSIQGKTILELGPGTSLIPAINFLGQGAAKVYLLDKYPRLNPNKPLTPTPEEITFFTTHYPQVAAKVLSKHHTLRRKFVTLHSKDLNHFRYKVDIIYSTSVLEHVTHPHQFIATMSAHLKPGGFMYHAIDLRDHYNFDQPFLFYRYSNFIWHHFLSKPGRSFTNRFRYHQFIDSFTHQGLNLTWEKKTSQSLPPNLKLHPHFAAMPQDSLQTTSLHLCLRKPKT